MGLESGSPQLVTAGKKKGPEAAIGGQKGVAGTKILATKNGVRKDQTCVTPVTEDQKDIHKQGRGGHWTNRGGTKVTRNPLRTADAKKGEPC